MNTRELLKQAARELREAGVPDPEYDSAVLLSRVMDVPPLQLRLGFTEPTEEQLNRFRELMNRRLKREPLQYIEGKAVFHRQEYAVRPGALIPRPETEGLVSWAAERAERWFRTQAPGNAKPLSGLRVLDLCCGSGCIGISLKDMFREAPLELTLTDMSPDALDIARENAERHGIACEILQGDLFAPLEGRRFDMILSNPPYIPSSECDTLQDEVKREPRMALDGGPDGMDFYRRIAEEAPKHLKPGGIVILEMGFGEAEAIRRLMETHSAVRTETRRDEAGIERILLAEYEMKKQEKDTHV